MESPAAADVESAEQPDPSRRRSGRVTKPPKHLLPSAPERKRKRPSDALQVPDLVSDNDGSLSSAQSGEEEEEEEEEGQATAKRRKSHRSKSTHINGTMPMRTGPENTTKSSKNKSRAVTNEAQLFDIISSTLLSNEDAVRMWLREFEKDQTNALMILINVLLLCAGCELKVNRYEIEDPDNAANKIGDLQEEYQAQNISDYPLIAKGGKGTAFKRNVTEFFDILVKRLAETRVLYDDPKVLDNLWVWMGSMSSSSNRPFRHTATVISLSMISALCEIARDLTNSRAKFLRQLEGEKKKKKANQSRVKGLESSAQSAAESLAQLNTIITDWFDALYLQRYRDMMPTLRVDCAQHLTHWTMTHPDQFFDGSHLRYLGWTLADQDKNVRSTVLKQLQIIYKDQSKTTGLHHFTERFRPRMVEMATRDVDHNIRATAVDLLTILRDAGLVEPSDVDTVGKLIYDSEPHIRKSVAPFLVASVDEIYAAYVDELGGEDAISEGLPTPHSEDLESVRQEWLRFKGLAELLVSFDPARHDNPDTNPSKELVTAAPTEIESRVCLATEAIYHLVPYLHQWGFLAGYLLADHSQSSNKTDVESTFRETCKLTDKEELVLLDVLFASVKSSLEDESTDLKDKKGKKPAKELQLRKEKHDEVAQHLAAFIPKLLNKFGAVPEAAAAVLRLENLLDLDVFQELRQDTNAFEILLDDIKKQFTSHQSVSVLTQAASALYHAKASGEFDDLVTERLQSLWDETTYALISQCRDQNLTVQGVLNGTVLANISTIVLRISVLSRLFNCVDALETPKKSIAPKSQRKQQKDSPTVPMDLLMQLLSHGRPQSRVLREMLDVENELVLNVMQCLLAYFLWHAHRLRSPQRSSQAFSETELITLAEKRTAISLTLHSIISERHGSDPIRIAAAKLLLDLHIVFVDRSGNAGSQALQELADQEMDPDWQADITKVFSALETTFANKSNRKLEGPSDDDEPEDLSDGGGESPSFDEANDAEDVDESVVARRQARAAKKKKEELLAEHTLCDFTGKIIRAIIAGVIDRVPERATAGIQGTPTASARRAAAGEVNGPIRDRLNKNRGRLGANFKALMELLDRDGLPAQRALKGATGFKRNTAAAEEKNVTKNGNVATEDDNEEEQDDDGNEDEVDADPRMDDEILEDQEDVADGEPTGDGEASEVESILGD